MNEWDAIIGGNIHTQYALRASAGHCRVPTPLHSGWKLNSSLNWLGRFRSPSYAPVAYIAQCVETRLGIRRQLSRFRAWRKISRGPSMCFGLWLLIRHFLHILSSRVTLTLFLHCNSATQSFPPDCNRGDMAMRRLLSLGKLPIKLTVFFSLTNSIRWGRHSWPGDIAHSPTFDGEN
jgi:hypothetical protein